MLPPKAVKKASGISLLQFQNFQFTFASLHFSYSIQFLRGGGSIFTIKFDSNTFRQAGASPVFLHFLPHRKDDWCSGDREFFSLFIPTDMLHQEENARISEILQEFFNNFESTEVTENLLFIAADFAENPPVGISPNMAFQWLYQMNCLAVLLPKLEIALLQSQYKTA